MQQLSPPYDFYHAPTEESATAGSAVVLPILAPVTGESFALTESPYAVDQIHLQGAGGWQRPRTQKLLAPARCKLLKASPCRRLWTFALSKSIRMHIQLKATCELPVAHQQAEPGALLQAGETFATLTAAALQHQPMILLTLQQVKSQTPLAVSWRSGQLTAGEDTIMTLHRIPSYQSAADLSTPSSSFSR